MAGTNSIASLSGTASFSRGQRLPAEQPERGGWLLMSSVYKRLEAAFNSLSIPRHATRMRGVMAVGIGAMRAVARVGSGAA